MTDKVEADYFICNGVMDRSGVLGAMEVVKESKSFPKAVLMLVTNGGDPDAAYKLARYFQSEFEHLTVCLPGMCKSAGTLIATAAHELSFAPYGELGPLDIQMSKRDDIAGLESGLNITEAFYSLSDHARSVHIDLIRDILNMSNGVISFQTASHSAAEIVSGMFSPIFGQIEPDEVGARARAMRIGQEYAGRLSKTSDNLRPYGEAKLCQTYPSHGFVIDRLEAQEIFHNVRPVNAIETYLIQCLGDTARHQASNMPLEILHLNNVLAEASTETGGPDELIIDQGTRSDGDCPKGSRRKNKAS